MEPGRDIAFWTFRAGTDGDYEHLVPHWKAMATKFNPTCAWFLVRQPDANMFHRAMAMCAHVNTPSLFTVPTVFMDVDAFPNADLREATNSVRDIGLTYRETPGLMPINEGVIFARPTEAAKIFFWAYLATFEALQELLTPADWAWWGGQLALNALTDFVTDKEDLVTAFLPCDIYNFSPDTDSDLSKAVLDTKAVIHLKGQRKAQFARMREYQEAR